MPTKSDPRFRVHRNRLLEKILLLAGLDDGKVRKGDVKLPRDFTGTFDNVLLPAANYHPGNGAAPHLPGTYTVKVYTQNNLATPRDTRRHNSPRHRVLVVCPKCEREIPYGRLHQHMPIHNQ